MENTTELAIPDKAELAQRRKKFSDELAEAARHWGPMPVEQAMVELGRCLTLCAPSGMTQGDREDWLTVAIGEIGEIPAGAFSGACATARQTCDHPAKIVPTIVRESAVYTSLARKYLAIARSKLAALDSPPAKPTALPEPDYIGAQDLGALVRKLEAGARDAA